MKKRVILSAAIAVLVAAAGLTVVSNRDLLLGSEASTSAEESVQGAHNRATATIRKTSAPTTQAPVTTVPPAELTNPAFKAENVTGAPNAGAGTITGYMPLPPANFTVNDLENSAGLPTTAINHSFGVAKDGQPHQISVNSQKMFDSKGYNAVTYDNVSDEKVLYLTFDCGYENGHTFDILDTLKEKNVSAAFFCTLDHIKSQPKLIARMITDGHVVGNHSDNHPNFTKISRSKMAQEIKNCDDYLRQNFGYTSPYFRFPEGAYSESALELVGSLGYKSVFWSLAYSDWDTANQKGKAYAYEKVTQRLHPGAIILLHSVSADNAAALGDIIDYALGQGYVFKPLTALPERTF